MTAISKNVYINKPSELVKEYNNSDNENYNKNQTCSCIDFSGIYKTKNPKFKVGDHMQT